MGKHRVFNTVHRTEIIQAIPLATIGHTVGYLPGAGDSVAQNLKEMGYTVEILDDTNLAPEQLRGPGESPLKGGLLVAQYGKGYFVYAGLVFFRELPAGAPGAFRLFANFISLGK
ncbi:MAG TPA: hypothetical protein VE860_19915 [Chthoniobacterales bacterium]|nr:hypothetical protein [Chthoniobacterales bacterium]